MKKVKSEQDTDIDNDDLRGNLSVGFIGEGKMISKMIVRS